MKFELKNLVRKNIRDLKPYSSARHEFKGEASVFLDANENSFGSLVSLPSPPGEGAGVRLVSFNRYPDPLQLKLKSVLSSIKNIPVANIFIGNGSDEAIDLAYRIFCEPGKDNVIICPPTYGMYEVSANINDVAIKKINLTKDFQLNVTSILDAVDENTKLLFICSPNNPTGNNMKKEDIELLVQNFPGIIIIDEAYNDFSQHESFSKKIVEFPNLVVMQTLSKAWGLAALRVGFCFGGKEIIDLFNKVKPPYNVNEASQLLAYEALQKIEKEKVVIEEIIKQRNFLAEKLSTFLFVKNIYESDANFLLVKVDDADKLYHFLLENKIVVRNRSRDTLCENCIRITVGTPGENEILLKALKNYT